MRLWILCIGLAYSFGLATPAWLGLLGFYCLVSVPYACLYAAWWANPVLFYGCIALARRRTRAASICGYASLLFALSHLFNRKSLAEIGIGYVFWVLSTLLLIAATFDTRPGPTKSPIPMDPDTSMTWARQPFEDDL